ncbi:DUF4352 domain-containing protein [Microbacterium sp. ARD32]|uniref:DUF4352 domain-containing protein n=1 Tax=Microbacterium sp. ARD32 TaxID=2962577 RepID=UPI00288160E5|nr:DUF4352 domain-containing protein [Microbacterium sp. ARD32]MDT0156341.1 DUF4352 domain-containing protein [Microbacterium sp. ARD32]
MAAFVALASAACTPQADEALQPVKSQTPAWSTPVPAPGGSTVDDVEESPAPVPTTEVTLKEPAELGGGVQARIDKVSPLDVKAETPGEIAGAAVAVSLTIDNDSDKAIDVSSAMVSLTGADGVLGQPTTSDPYRPFQGTVRAGGTADAVYVFLLPEKARSAFVVSVQYLAGTTMARFAEGS